MPCGFLPWGLSNTYPQARAVPTSVACDGQMSDNPKQEQVMTTGGYAVRWLGAATAEGPVRLIAA